MKTNAKIFSLILIGLVFTAMVFGFSQTSGRVFAQTPYQTPTPNEQGSVIYIVQAGEWCSTIQERTGVPISEIIRLNNLTEACSIFEGQQLVLARVEVTPLPPTPTATIPPELITPTLTPMPGLARICVVLFHDMNGNGMRNPGEDFLYGGEVSVNDRSGTVSLTGTTVAGDPEQVTPLCFNDIPVGSYNISIAIPDDFNPTTVTNYPLEVRAGEEATIDFGGQLATPPDSAVVPDTAARVPVLAIVGGIILLAGIGLGVYMLRSNKAD